MSSTHDDNTFCGWNSGGDLKTLQKDQPESWATAVVHMFLWELKDVLSTNIQDRVLFEYRAVPLAKSEPNEKNLNDLLDIELSMRGKQKRLRKDVLKPLVAAISKRDKSVSKFDLEVLFRRLVVHIGLFAEYPVPDPTETN